MLGAGYQMLFTSGNVKMEVERATAIILHCSITELFKELR